MKCLSCALKHTSDREDEWIEPGIYVINGQGVCEKHIGAPYRHPEHGFGGMQARYRVDRFADLEEAREAKP